MRRWSSVVGCAALALSAAPVGAAVPRGAPESELAAAADAAYRGREWTEATSLYERLVQRRPDGFRNWLRLGECLHGLGENARALEAYARARTQGAPASAVQYGVAVALAATGDGEGAYAALEEAVQQGHGRPDLLLSDPDLRPLRAHAGFARLVQQAQSNQAPCESRAESRQFDFWVGDWNVVTTNEFLPVGRSHIERTLGDCVVWENWTSLGESGYTGKSYNVYHPERQRWEQFWVDNQGGTIHFYGGLIDGVMDLRTDAIAQPDGTAVQRRLRFYNLGADRVRQLSEQSSDGGRTWTVEYDFSYRRTR